VVPGCLSEVGGTPEMNNLEKKKRRFSIDSYMILSNRRTGIINYKIFLKYTDDK